MAVRAVAAALAGWLVCIPVDFCELLGYCQGFDRVRTSVMSAGGDWFVGEPDRQYNRLMHDATPYGVLTQVSEDTVEWAVNGRLERVWALAPPETTVSQLVRRCLTSLARDGWRPITHDRGPPRSVVLARVPYPAGAHLQTFGVLRWRTDGTLALTVSGATMKTWADSGQPSIDGIIAELEEQGWRVHRRFRTGVTVVRG